MFAYIFHMNLRNSQRLKGGRCNNSSRKKKRAVARRVVTRAASSTLLSSRAKRTRKPSRTLLESIAADAQIPPNGKTEGCQPPQPQNDTIMALDKPKSRRRSTPKALSRSDIDIDTIHCCLCNLSIDYSDKELFVSEEADAGEDNIENVKLPHELYDPQNGILICDSPGCNRAYHQRCHFIPVLSIPKGRLLFLYSTIFNM